MAGTGIRKTVHAFVCNDGTCTFSRHDISELDDLGLDKTDLVQVVQVTTRLASEYKTATQQHADVVKSLKSYRVAISSIIFIVMVFSAVIFAAAFGTSGELKCCLVRIDLNGFSARRSFHASVQILCSVLLSFCLCCLLLYRSRGHTPDPGSASSLLMLERRARSGFRTFWSLPRMQNVCSRTRAFAFACAFHALKHFAQLHAKCLVSTSTTTSLSSSPIWSSLRRAPTPPLSLQLWLQCRQTAARAPAQTSIRKMWPRLAVPGYVRSACLVSRALAACF